MSRTALALTTADLLTLHDGDTLDRIAVVEGDRRITYRQLQVLVETVAGRLVELGVERGDRVVVHLRKSVEEVVAMFAAWRIGAVAVNVNAVWTVQQLAYVISDCGAVVAIVDGKRASELGGTLPTPLRHVVVKGSAPAAEGFSAWPTSAAAVPNRRLLDADLAAILYTSGSTGSPKGVMLTHTNLLVGARSVARYTDQTGDDRLLSLLSFGFDYGLNQLLTASLLGARVVLMPLSMPSVVVAALQKEGVTGFAAVPPVWHQLVKYLEEARIPLPSLRYVTNSGGALSKPVLDAMRNVFPGVRVHCMYGFTEAFRSTQLPPEQFTEKPGSIGQAVPNAETFVVVRGRGLAKPGETGELVHRGSFISCGYWGRPDATAEKIRPVPELADLLGDEKVAWSGDLVRIDEDGDLWFVGREDHMIKSLGFRISPTEVEDVIHRSGLVAEVIAFGVADEMAGQVVHICVSGRSSGGSKPVVDRAAVDAYSRAHLPAYMVPRQTHVWSGSMPRTPSGKLDVRTVVDACKAGKQPS